MGHTLLLMQMTNLPTTRTYTDHDTLEDCLHSICQIYETHLKDRNPEIGRIEYDLTHLFDFIDKLKDVNCLVYRESIKAYGAYNREWIKEKLYIFLSESACGPPPE